MIINNNSRVQDLFSYKNESNNIVKISNDEQLPEALIFLSNNKNEKLTCFLNKKFKTLDSETINKILTNVFEKSIQNESMDVFCPKFLSLDVWEKLGKPNEIAEVWFQLDKLQIHEVTTNSKLKKILKKGLIYSLFFNIILRSGNLLIKDIKNNKFFFFNDSILYSILKKVTYFTLCFSTAYLVVGSLILIIKSLNLYFNQKKMNEFPSFPFIIYPDSNSKITQLSKVLPHTCKNALDIKKIFIKKVKDSKPLKLLNEITLLKQQLNIQKEKDASNFFKLDFSPSINSINKALNEKKSLLKVQIAELNEIHSLTQKYKTCYERCHLIAKKILRSKNNSNLEKELIHLTKIVLPSIRNIQKTKIKSFNLKYNEKTMFYLDKTIIKDLSSDIYSEIITDELNKYFEVKFGLNKNNFSKLGIQFCFSKNDVQALIQELKNNFPIIFSNRNNNKPVNFESDLKYELSQFFKKLGGENENPNFSISLLKENLAILIAKDLIEIFLNKKIIIEDETDLT